MKLIGSVTSPFVRKARVVLLEKRIDYDFILDDVHAATSQVELHNPLGKVPVLVLDDGTALYDSPVIVEYLDTVTPVGRLIPEPTRPRIQVKRWEALADGLLDAAVAIVMENRRPVAERSAASIHRQQGKVDRALGAMAQELGERNWCVGEAFNLADIATGCALFYLDFRFPEVDWRRQYLSLARLADKLAKRKSFEDTAPPTP